MTDMRHKLIDGNVAVVYRLGMDPDKEGYIMRRNTRGRWVSSDGREFGSLEYAYAHCSARLSDNPKGKP